MLAEKWKLPAMLLEGINSHHSIEDNDNEGNKLLINAVFVANKLSKEFAEKNNIESFSDGTTKDIVSRFGTNLNECIASPEELRIEVVKSLEFIR
jgi:HD-like signal output (HDOD) protein